MSASERLAALQKRWDDIYLYDKGFPDDYGPEDEYGTSLTCALPEIVAVVRAAEKLVEDGTAPITDEIVYVIRASTRDEIKSSVAALEAKLAEK